MAKVKVRQLPARQRTRKALLLVSFLVLPITLFYFSPYLVQMAAAQGVVNGSLFHLEGGVTMAIPRDAGPPPLIPGLLHHRCSDDLFAPCRRTTGDVPHGLLDGALYDLGTAHPQSGALAGAPAAGR